MNTKKLLFLPLLLIAVAMSGEPVVRIVDAGGSNKDFATDQVRKLVLTSTAVDVVSNEGSVLLSVPVSDILRVEFTEGTPTSVEATLIKDDEAVKIMERGQVFILRSGKKYTIMGVEIDN